MKGEKLEWELVKEVTSKRLKDSGELNQILGEMQDHGVYLGGLQDLYALGLNMFEVYD